MNGAHLHLVLTHLPVVGILVASGLLAVGLWRRQEVLSRAGLVLFALSGLGAGAAYLTGEGAEDTLEGIGTISESVVDRHEDAAGIALGASVVVGVLSLGLLWLSRGRSLRRRASVGVLVVGLGASGLLAWTANLGGQIRHTEIGVPRAGVTQPGGEDED
jgi:uncharacterized membrane protein